MPGPGKPNTHSSQVQQLLSSYTNICHAAAAGAADTSDEFLYGRAGTLFGALLLRQQLGAAAVPDAAVGALVGSILASGGQAVLRHAMLMDCSVHAVLAQDMLSRHCVLCVSPFSCHTCL